MIHLFIRDGKPNLCGARENIVDTRTNDGHVRKVGHDVIRVWAYPRGTDAAIEGGDTEQPMVGLLVHESRAPLSKPRRLVVAQSMICPRCMLIYTVMNANGNASKTTVLAVLKRAGELK